METIPYYLWTDCVFLQFFITFFTSRLTDRNSTIIFLRLNQILYCSYMFNSLCMCALLCVLSTRYNETCGVYRKQSPSKWSELAQTLHVTFSWLVACLPACFDISQLYWLFVQNIANFQKARQQAQIVIINMSNEASIPTLHMRWYAVY